MEKPKPILVTGATGSIGSVLVRRLREIGRPVRVVVRSPGRAAGLFDGLNVEIIPGDLTRPDSLRGCAEGCAVVYHCAAVLSSSNWAKSYAANVNGTQAIVDEAARAGVERLVYTSTIGVYGVCRAEVITEETAWARYHQPYFETKQQAERIVWGMADRVPVCIARVGDVMGPGQYTWTIAVMQRIQQGLMIPPLDSQSGYLNPIYIDNLIDALVRLGSHPAAAGQIFNVVDGFPIRASDYYRRYHQMAGKPFRTLPVFLLKIGAAFWMGYDRARGREATATPGAINYLLRKGKIYPTKLRALLGWAPAVSQEEAFIRTEHWLRQHGDLAQVHRNARG